MGLSNLSQIEHKIIQLSREEQLLLVERIVHHLREENLKEESLLESQLAAMAADQDIQTELQKINEEFTITASDGLDKV